MTSLQAYIDALEAKLESYQQQVIAVLSENPLLICLLLYACKQLDKKLFPLNPQMPVSQQQKLLQQAGCDLLLTDMDVVDVQVGVLQIDTAAFPKMPLAFKPPGKLIDDEDDVRLVLASSGSSGLSKGVMLSSQALSSSAKAVNKVVALEQKSQWLNCLPLYHVGGLSILYRCALANAGMLLSKFDALTVWTQIQGGLVTHISLVPVMLSLLLDVSKDARPSTGLTLALIGGAPLPVSLARRAHAAGWPIAVSYGMTETASACALDVSPEAGLVSGRVGRVLEGFEIITGKKNTAIKIKGPALMSGYLNPGLTEGRGLQQGWYHSGDAGALDTDGNIVLHGRLDDVLISGGKNILPGEVESELEKFTGIGKVAVTSLPDAVWGERLIAVYEQDGIDGSSLQAHAQQLPPGLRPREFVAVDALPLNAMGKLDRTRLRQMIFPSGK